MLVNDIGPDNTFKGIIYGNYGKYKLIQYFESSALIELKFKQEISMVKKIFNFISCKSKASQILYKVMNVPNDYNVEDYEEITRMEYNDFTGV